MKLYLYNSISKQKELFNPIDEKNVRMYVCGPTVYDSPHIGNARSAVVYDLLYRLLELKYSADHVTYVRNITDVDDKINARAKELGITIQKLTHETTIGFHDDMRYLYCESPDIEPRATENIDAMIMIIEKLIAHSHAYISHGHVYFSVLSYKDYCKLSGRKLDEMIAGARIDVSEIKHHPGDFVLWKPADSEDDPSSIFDSPWGPGRPGWHIECSAMSYRFLGEDFDIHGGGADLLFPHHTNEIAQSCCAFKDSKFAHIWVHNGFLTVSGEKMSKSLGNFVTVQDLRSKNVKGEIIRCLLLGTHYRKPLDFNEKAVYDATEFLNYLYRSCSNLTISEIAPDDDFISFLMDDMNTSEAFSYLHEKAKEINKEPDYEKKSLLASSLKSCCNLMGLMNYSPEEWFTLGINASEVEELLSIRTIAKQNKDWAKADEVRNKLTSMGITLEDKPDGSTIWRAIS
ncbi:MAG: cysteine--tRNA ligase [Rickettsiaceae bacterium]|nr:cysteine--tRNA ligase [Rickettsiaceae bacterium]